MTKRAFLVEDTDARALWQAVEVVKAQLETLLAEEDTTSETASKTVE